MIGIVPVVEFPCEYRIPRFVNVFFCSGKKDIKFVCHQIIPEAAFPALRYKVIGVGGIS